MNGEIITQPQSTNEIAFRRDNQQELFKRFIFFIDASPNTVRTYKASLRQWFNYLYQVGASNPTPDTVRAYRQHLRDTARSRLQFRTTSLP